MRGRRAFPLWLKIAIPVVIVVIAVAAVAAVAAGGDDGDDTASAPKHVASTTSTSTTAPATTTTSLVAPATEPAPPGAGPLTSGSPVLSGPVTARVQLPSTSIGSGSTMSGTLIVDNPGAALQIGTCDDYFAVVLTSDIARFHQPPEDQCLTSMTIPTGTSSYPITISAFFASCNAVDTPPCLPDGSLRPLPRGEYSLYFWQASRPPVSIAIEPATVTVL
jgi:hypothetical protein